MRAKMKACMTCLHFMHDGKCHRYPPAAPIYEVTYNLVTRHQLADRDGNARLDFPKVDESMVCGEWMGRLSDEPDDDEIIRCHDCRYAQFYENDSMPRCAGPLVAQSTLVDPDGYCAWGARRG